MNAESYSKAAAFISECVAKDVRRGVWPTAREAGRGPTDGDFKAAGLSNSLHQRTLIIIVGSGKKREALFSLCCYSDQVTS